MAAARTAFADDMEPLSLLTEEQKSNFKAWFSGAPQWFVYGSSRVFAKNFCKDGINSDFSADGIADAYHFCEELAEM